MGCGLIAGAIVWLVLAEHGALGGVAAVLVGLGSWWLETLLHPFAPCWWCRGKPRTAYSWCTPTAWRECRVCGGRGKRRRILARSK